MTEALTSAPLMPCRAAVPAETPRPPKRFAAAPDPEAAPADGQAETSRPPSTPSPTAPATLPAGWRAPTGPGRTGACAPSASALLEHKARSWPPTPRTWRPAGPTAPRAALLDRLTLNDAPDRRPSPLPWKTSPPCRIPSATWCAARPCPTGCACARSTYPWAWWPPSTRPAPTSRSTSPAWRSRAATPSSCAAAPPPPPPTPP